MKPAFALALLVVLAACETARTPLPVDGSKADGRVDLAVTYSGFEKVTWKWDDADAEAARVCQGWGYAGAQRLGSIQEFCTQGNAYGCTRYEARVPYQCGGVEAAQGAGTSAF